MTKDELLEKLEKLEKSGKIKDKDTAKRAYKYILWCLLLNGYNPKDFIDGKITIK